MLGLSIIITAKDFSLPWSKSVLSNSQAFLTPGRYRMAHDKKESCTVGDLHSAVCLHTVCEQNTKNGREINQRK